MENLTHSYYHRLYGKNIKSDLDLKYHSSKYIKSCDLELKAASGPMRRKYFKRIHQVRDIETRQVLAEIFMGRGAYLMCIRHIGAFLFKSGGSQVKYKFRDHIVRKDRQAIVINQILPLACQLQGHLVLHASVVYREGFGAIAFVAHQGTGKSTLASSLVGRGFQLISDDAAVMYKQGKYWCVASAFPEIRLTSESFKRYRLGGRRVSSLRHFSKSRVFLPESFAKAKRPRLKYLFVVERGAPKSRLRFESLSGIHAFSRIIPHLYRIDLITKNAKVREVQDLSNLVGSIHVELMNYPRRWSALSKAIKRVESALD